MSGPLHFSSADVLPRSPEGKNEEWKPSSFHSFFVSTLGRAFNMKSERLVRGTVFNAQRPILSLVVMVDDRAESRSLAFLVAEAFVQVPAHLRSQKLQVKHLDGDVQNNQAANLAWAPLNQGIDRGDDWLPPVEPLPEEQWRRFRGSQYYVSSLGRVFSAKSLRLRLPVKEKTGYWRMILKSTGTFLLHRLVAECFIPLVPGKDQVNHIDGNPDNNRASNLEWVTPKENSQHAVETGLSPSGENHTRAKLANEQVAMARAMYDSGEWTFEALAQHFGVSRQTATRAVTGSTRHDAPHDPLEANDEAATTAKTAAANAYWSQTAEKRIDLKQQRSTFNRRSTEKLTAQQVLAIREALQTERPQAVADRFKLGLYSVMSIQAGRTYGWVAGPDSQPPKPGPKPK